MILHKFKQGRIPESINDNYQSKEDLATVIEESFVDSAGMILKFQNSDTLNGSKVLIEASIEKSNVFNNTLEKQISDEIDNFNNYVSTIKTVKNKEWISINEETQDRVNVHEFEQSAKIKFKKNIEIIEDIN